MVGLTNSALAPKLYVNYWFIAHQVRIANVSSLAEAAKRVNNISVVFVQYNNKRERVGWTLAKLWLTYITQRHTDKTVKLPTSVNPS